MLGLVKFGREKYEKVTQFSFIVSEATTIEDTVVIYLEKMLN